MTRFWRNISGIPQCFYPPSKHAAFDGDLKIKPGAVVEAVTDADAAYYRKFPKILRQEEEKGGEEDAAK